MRRSQMKSYNLKRRVVTKNREGGPEVSYEAAVPIKATIWPAGGRIQAEMYGERLSYIKNMEYEGQEEMKEGDGICVFVDADADPDYKIISIKPELTPKLMELEKI